MRLLAGRELPPDEEAEQGTLLYSRAIKSLGPLEDDEDVDDGPTEDPDGFESSMVPTELAALEGQRTLEHELVVPSALDGTTSKHLLRDPDTLRKLLGDSTTQHGALGERTTRPRRIGEPVTLKNRVAQVTDTVPTPPEERTRPVPHEAVVEYSEPVIETDVSGVLPAELDDAGPEPVAEPAPPAATRPPVMVFLMGAAALCAVLWCAGLGFLVVRLVFG